MTALAATQKGPLTEILDAARDASRDSGRIRLGELLETFEERTFGVCFALLGLIAITPPISGIPGVPSLSAMMVLLIASQLLLGREHVWLPGLLRRVSVRRGWVRIFKSKSGEAVQRIDGLVYKRHSWATRGPARIMASLAVIALSFTMVPLELVPFAVMLPAMAIIMIGLALMAEDGLMMLIAMGFTVLAAGLIALLLFTLIR